MTAYEEMFEDWWNRFTAKQSSNAETFKAVAWLAFAAGASNALAKVIDDNHELLKEDSGK